ncbi:MAG TPA: hypothetical protein VF020_05730, partial [Chthoniobacterales bacterium]
PEKKGIRRKQMPTPKLYHVANLWSLTDYPSVLSPSSLEEQLDAVKAAGFDGFTTHSDPTMLARRKSEGYP